MSLYLSCRVSGLKNEEYSCHAFFLTPHVFLAALAVSARAFAERVSLSNGAFFVYPG